MLAFLAPARVKAILSFSLASFLAVATYGCSSTKEGTKDETASMEDGSMHSASPKATDGEKKTKKSKKSAGKKKKSHPSAGSSSTMETPSH